MTQFTALKLTILFIKNKNHTEVCKCNAPDMYMQFVQLKRNENFIRIEYTVSLGRQIADLLSL